MRVVDGHDGLEDAGADLGLEVDVEAALGQAELEQREQQTDALERREERLGRGRLEEPAPSVRGTGEDDSSISGVRWFEASTGQLPARSDRQICSAAAVPTEPPSLMSLVKVTAEFQGK